MLHNHKWGELKLIMSDKQIQKAGDNSQQIQAQTVIVNSGIEENVQEKFLRKCLMLQEEI